MKIPQIVDTDDVRHFVQGSAYAVIAGALLVGLAGAAGLAWTVLKLAGGL